LRQQQKIFPFSEEYVQTGCVALKASHHVATGDLYPRVSRSVREADHSPLSSARFKTEDINPLPIHHCDVHGVRFVLDPQIDILATVAISLPAGAHTR